MRTKSLLLIIGLIYSLTTKAFAPQCEDFFLPPIPKMALDEIQELKIGTYNVLNLTQSVGQYKMIDGEKIFVLGYKEKPAWQKEGIAQAIRESNLDIVVLQEVEGLEALKMFNASHLKNEYFPISIKGNDERGIDIGFLIKKNLPFEIQVDSYKAITWKNPLKNYQESSLFSRDLPVMKIYFRNESPRGPPDMMLMGTHYKSQRPSGSDMTSVTQREAQVKETVNIIKDLQAKYPSTPIMLAGDFNGDINNPEFKSLTQNGLLQETMELKGVPKQDRVTHTFHPNGEETKQSQLDAIMITPNFRDYLKDSQVYRYKDENGKIKPIPADGYARNRNPSDHFLVNISIDFSRWFNRP